MYIYIYIYAFNVDYSNVRHSTECVANMLALHTFLILKQHTHLSCVIVQVLVSRSAKHMEDNSTHGQSC